MSLDRGERRYEQRTSATRWRDGVQNPRRNPSEGLSEAGVNMAGRESEFDSTWRDGANSEDAQNAYDRNTDGSRWRESMSDAGNWNIGGN